MASNALQVDNTHNSDVVGDIMAKANTQNKVVQHIVRAAQYVGRQPKRCAT